MLDTPNATSLRTAQFLLDLPAALDLTGGASPTRNEIAKQIRADLAAAQKAGLLPKLAKFSVKQNSGRYWNVGGSITVSIAAWSGAVHSTEYVEAILDGDSSRYWHASRRASPAACRYAPAFAAALDLIEAIANRHNFDRSRIEEDYFDVGYYLNVHGGKAEAEALAGLKAEAKAIADRRAADDAIQGAFVREAA